MLHFLSRSNRPRATDNPAAVHIVYFDHGTDIPISVAHPSHRIRLYSTKTLKPLGTLDYHKDGIQAITFARNALPPPHPPKNQGGEGGVESRAGATSASAGEGDGVGDDDDEFSGSEIEARKRWLVAGGKDGRVSVWELMDFTKPKP